MDSAREAQLRRDLRASARSRRSVYVTSGWAIEELATLAEHDPQLYRRIVRFLLELCGDQLVDDPPSLAERELRIGRPLRGSERMIPRDTYPAYRRAALDPAIARKISEETRREKREGKVELTAMRETIWKQLAELSRDDPRAKGDPKAATLAWFAEVDRWLDEWSRNSLAAILKGLGRDPEAAQTYPLERVPTVVNIVAGMLARVAWNAGHGRRIDESDDVDTWHYVAACYADVFVSSDRRLAEIIDLLPHPRVRLVSLAEFAREHLGW